MAFSEHATWRGIPIRELTQDQYLQALEDKLTELRWCYQEMTVSQQRKVGERLKAAGL